MIFIFSLFCFLLTPFYTEAVPVRVLLGQKKKGSWSISSAKGFVLRDRITDRALTLKGTRHTFNLECRPTGVYLENKKLFSDNILFEPIDGITCFNGKKYEGAFYIQKDKNFYLFINILPLEDYIFSVLKTESWPGWPLEVNKVFAVACRTYFLHRFVSSQLQDAIYHIKNTNHHQTYSGFHECPIIRQAVHETRGLFLGHEGKPILAMFDCCCGGVIPAHIDGKVDFVKAPYLSRTYACTFCKSCKIFNWSATYDVEHFIDLLQEGSSGIIHDVHNVKISHKDKAGLVRHVSVKTPRGLFAFGAHQMYKLLKEVKSYCFSISKKGKKVTLKGKGYGHHIGLCQWGAREMVRRGFDHKKILSFYYPNTKFMRLEQKRS